MKGFLLKRIKVFTTFISIFAMLNLSIGVVYAQSQEADAIQAPAAQEVEQRKIEVPRASVAKKEKGELRTRTAEVDLTKTDIANSEFVYFLTMIGMTLFMMSLWRYKPMSTDMKIAMGAAVVMMAAEIVSYLSTRKSIDAGTYKVEIREDGTVNNMQLDALKKQRESYESIKKYAGLKIKMAMAGTAAFAVATVMAHMEGSRLRGLQKACAVSIKAAAASAPLAIPSCRTGLVKPFTELGLNFETPNKTTIKGAAQEVQLTEAKTVMVACGADFKAEAATASSIGGAAGAAIAEQGTIIAKMNTACTTYLTNMYIYNNKKEAVPFKVAQEDFQSSLQSTSVATAGSAPSFDRVVSSLINVIFPVANASLASLGLGATVIMAVTAIANKGYLWMDTFVLNPTHRAHLYTATAAGLGLVIMMTKKAEAQAQNNIDKIDEMIASFERLQNMQAANLKNTIQTTGLAQGLLPQDLAGTQITGDGSKFPCPPKVGSTGKCDSIEQGINESSDLGSLGGVLGNIASLSGRVADGIAGQDSLSAGTIKNIDQLASQSAIAQRAAREMEKQINEQEIASGLEPTNFEKQREGMMARLMASTSDALKGTGMSAQAAVAALGATMPTEEEKKNLAEEMLKLETSSVAATGGANMDNVAAPVFDFSFEDDEFEEVPLEEEFAYSDEMYAKAFESQANSSDGGTSQIVGNRDVSLFKVISVRYMKSGLPRLLDELQELE